VLSTATQVVLSSFGSNSPSFQTLGVAIPSTQIQKFTEDLVPISVLIVPKIATPIQNSCPVELDNIPHLKGLQLANPVTNSEEFLVSILIRVDYYWSFLQNHILEEMVLQHSNPDLAGPQLPNYQHLSCFSLLQLTTKRLISNNYGHWYRLS